MEKHKRDVKKAPGEAARAGADFSGLGIAPKILEVLERIKFRVPTPIQLKAIPVAIEGSDIIGVAQTGTGKTLAYAVPMVQLLAEKTGTGLVLAPTRELALQIEEGFRELAGALRMKTACLIGGAPIYSQTQALLKKPRIVIATPGRLLDHINRKNFHPGRVTKLVIDEADRMLDMGFAPQIEEILADMTRQRQTMLFSATIPEEIIRMVNRHMRLPVHVEIAPSGTAAEGILQELYIVKRETKLKLLARVLDEHGGTVLLFVRTKHAARKIAKAVRDMGHRASDIHSDKTLGQRRKALEGFKTGLHRVLVATDVASRGIDVKKIEVVINYDLPDDIENYVHRIGRTGRAGDAGRAISFATPDQRRDINSIEKMIRMQLTVKKHPEIQLERFSREKAKEKPAPRRNRPESRARSKPGRNPQRRPRRGPAAKKAR